MEKIVSLCKRRGFVWQSSEIYGGFSSCYDYGPLGVELKNNIKKAWWQAMVREEENIVGLDAAILMSPKVWQASGHLTAGFADSLVECKKCHHRFRKDQLRENKCPDCGGNLTPERKFNLMMRTFCGPVESKAAVTYLRAETCQGIYMNYKNVLESMRLKIPFGIAQIGKAFRNEITPKDFIYRTREFEQMEMEWFCLPEEADKWFDYFKEKRMNWYLGLGIKKENLRFRAHQSDELAHYAKKAVDIEYHFPFGWKEIEGIHNRTDFDLKNHGKFSGQDLSYFEEKTRQKYIPYIIETSAGADRGLFVFLIDAFTEIIGGRTTTTKSTKAQETVLKLNKKLAPIKIAVLPLIKKEPLIKIAQMIYADLRKYWLVQYDETGAIGRRYRRQDEIGTPFCVTVDFASLDDKKATVRNRDTMKQERVAVKDLKDYFKKVLNF